MPFGQSRPSAAKRGARGQIAQGKIHFLMEKKGENGGGTKSTSEVKNGANIHAKAAEKGCSGAALEILGLRFGRWCGQPTISTNKHRVSISISNGSALFQRR